MRLYPDASILIAATVSERMTEPALRLLDDADDLCGSAWLLTEVASGLGVKERRGDIRPPTRHRSLAACKRLIAASATLLPLTNSDCQRATELIERSSLRGGDALHLAVAERGHATLWTLDRRMAEAGQALGLDVRLLS